MTTLIGLTNGGTFKGELHRSAELLVEIAEEQGVYSAIAFLCDAGYDQETIQILLPILQKTRGAIKDKG